MFVKHSKLINQFDVFKKPPPEVFYKKLFFKNFVIFTGKHLFWILFLIKFQIWRPAILSKRDSNTDVSIWILQSFKKKTVLKNICKRPLLFLSNSVNFFKQLNTIWIILGFITIWKYIKIKKQPSCTMD